MPACCEVVLDLLTFHQRVVTLFLIFVIDKSSPFTHAFSTFIHPPPMLEILGRGCFELAGQSWFNFYSSQSVVFLPRTRGKLPLR